MLALKCWPAQVVVLEVSFQPKSSRVGSGRAWRSRCVRLAVTVLYIAHVYIFHRFMAVTQVAAIIESSVDQITC